MGNKKAVVLTGSFNPVTRAHFDILSCAVDFAGADEGLFVATNDAYLTKKTVVKAHTPFKLSEDVRRKMLESLSAENPKLHFGGYELGGADPSTVRTLKCIVKKREIDTLYFAIGADKFNGLQKWKDIDKMFEYMYLIVFARGNINLDGIIAGSPLFTKFRLHILLLNLADYNLAAFDEDVSSTALREKFFAGEDYHDMMNEGPYKILSRFTPADFPPLTAEQIIEANIRYGGRFGENAARMLVFKENARRFNNWDDTVFGSRDAKIKGTKVYRNEFKVSADGEFNTEIDCVNADCADVARDMIDGGLHPAIHNLASLVHPCGGYNKGLNAQEESLCYMSTLSVSLYQFGNPKKKYIRDSGVPLTAGVYPLDFRFGGIYSPKVCFFRENLAGYYALRDHPFECDVVTVASLSNRAHGNEFCGDETAYFTADGRLTEEGKEIERDKIRTVFRIALDNGNDSVVLGAFGCGAYRMLPEDVSALFEEVINEDEFKGKFKKLVFAIYEKASRNRVTGESGKFKPFYDRFAKR